MRGAWLGSKALASLKQAFISSTMALAWGRMARALRVGCMPLRVAMNNSSRKLPRSFFRL
ncbi:hypothetical protein D3C84_1296830 [compost metagenome]